MARGLSLHIGLNRLDPQVFPDWSSLDSPENDARAMQRIADSQGYSSNHLLSEQATAAAILGEIESAAHLLETGDIFLLTFAGHGRSLDGNTNEPFNQTWVAFDRQIIDDELYCAWRQFSRGVRIVVVSDSCFSGSILDSAVRLAGAENVGGAVNLYALQKGGVIPGTPRTPSPKQAAEHFERFRERYLDLAAEVAPCRQLPPSEAMVLLLAACRDDQDAIDGPTHGVFTESLLQVFDAGNFADYREFFRLVVNGMTAEQTPQYYALTANIEPLERRRPFDI